MNVECEVEEVELVNDRGFDQPGVRVTCSRCGETAEAFGTAEKSVRRCCIELRNKCPRNEANFYTVSE